MLLKVGHIALQAPYGEWAEHLLGQPGFALATVDVRMLAKAYYYPFPDPFDSVITATARVMDVSLMTNDAEINASQLTEVYWEAASSGVRKREVLALHQRGKPSSGFPHGAHHLKTARHFGALNVQVSTQSRILAL
jgi:hypothetical protein